MKDNHFVKTHQPCPCQKSSDAFSINADGSGYCFSCNEFKGGKRGLTETEIKKPFAHRKISSKTFEDYGVLTSFVNDQPNEVFFPFGNDTFKVRNFNKKDFYSVGDMKGAGIFGKQVTEPGSKGAITITEGEYDALAIWEILKSQTASVSLKTSGSAEKDLQKDWEYINSFDKIILCFDSDEVGENTLKKCARLFDFNKLYYVEMTKYKDANDYLENNAVGDFIAAWKGAKRYSPNNILSTFDDIKKALKSPSAKRVLNYPFGTLQRNLKGLHRGEFILAKGLQGIGKTEWCRALIDEGLRNHETKMATIFLEEDEKTTIEGVATYHIGELVSLDDSAFSMDDVLGIYTKAVKGDDSRLFIHSHMLSDNERELVDNIRFLVTVAGVEVVFLDNLTMLNNGREGDDERLRIDRTIRMLRNLVNELQFCLVLIAHTNEDGTTRGSRLPDIVANTVVRMTRKIPENKIFFDVDKARLRGSMAGPSGFGEYNVQRFRLEEPVFDKSQANENKATQPAKKVSF